MEFPPRGYGSCLPGFQPDQVIAFSLWAPPAGSEGDPEVATLFRSVVGRVQALPGVRSVGGVLTLPPTGAWMIMSFEVERRAPLPAGQRQALVVRAVTPDYFRTLGIRVRSGRGITPPEVAGAQPVAVLSEEAVRRYFPDENALGRMITLAWKQEPLRSMDIAVRAAAEPTSLAAAIRREIGTIDPNLPVANLRTLDDVVSRSVAQPRFYMLMLTIFAAVALVLAAVGIYGVMSYTVAQRTREIGIRLALGAAPGRVLRIVVVRAVGLAMLGVALGLAGAAALTRFLQHLLFGVTATDPLTFAAVALVVTGVAFMASYLPARAASRVDPLLALRAE